MGWFFCVIALFFIADQLGDIRDELKEINRNLKKSNYEKSDGQIKVKYHGTGRVGG